RLQDAQKASILSLQRQREEETLRAAETARDQATIELERLSREAGCAHFDQHAQAEFRWEHRARLAKDRAACEEDLMAAAAGSDRSSFIAQAEQADQFELDSRLKEMDQVIAAEEAKQRHLDQTIGTERAELARMDGSDRAAESAETAQSLLARLSGDVA